jgi:ABC-type transport system involved in multi-copper enzyme maturation permease subunit
LLIGPVFSREVVTAPRRPRLYVARAAYVSALLVLACTAWLLVTGTQIVRNLGDIARFGAMLFQILAPLQLGLAIFFSSLLAAAGVAQEKDRRTLVLLLLTNLTNSELVLGKLLASLLNVLVLLAAALPLFMLAALLGGVSFAQIARVFAVTLATVVVAGSIGSLVALWREKTFQTLALTALVLVFWLGAGEAVAWGAFGSAWLGASADVWAAAFSPWQAIIVATRPLIEAQDALPYFGHAINLFLLFACALTVIVNVTAILLVRVWNPSREVRSAGRHAEEAESIWGLTEESAAIKGQVTRSVHAAAGDVRPVWDNPVLWREVRTWAYGRRVLIVRLAYLSLVGAALFALHRMIATDSLTMAAGALVLVPLLVLSLVLVNAQAVTSLTSERDVKAIDLLLVTDLTAKEFVFGKLGGVLYNTKEMVLLPMALCGYLWWQEVISGEDLLYLLGGLAVMNLFVAVLGIHSGMSYGNSRTAIGVSLGTVFFLFVGIATCMRMMIAFHSFHWQVQPFLAFMLGGAVGLYAALGARNPSVAIGVASMLCPIATFWAITSFLLHYTLSVFLVTVATYGFATAAMLVPAIFEFDVATGRTTVGDE